MLERHRLAYYFPLFRGEKLLLGHRQKSARFRICCQSIDSVCWLSFQHCDPWSWPSAFCPVWLWLLCSKYRFPRILVVAEVLLHLLSFRLHHQTHISSLRALRAPKSIQPGVKLLFEFTWIGWRRPIFLTSRPERQSRAPCDWDHLISTLINRSNRTFEIDWSWINAPSVGDSRFIAVVVSKFSPSILIWMKLTVKYCESRLLFSLHNVCRIMAEELNLGCVRRKLLFQLQSTRQSILYAIELAFWGTQVNEE